MGEHTGQGRNHIREVIVINLKQDTRLLKYAERCRRDNDGIKEDVDTMPKIDINGVRLHYEESGKGSSIILIHGMGGSVFDWVMQIPFFSKSYHVIAIEMRDHGESDKWSGPYDIQMFSEDLAQFVRKLKLGKTVFFGVSMGGMIVMQFALDHPDMVEALVLADTQPGLSEETIKAGLEMASMSQRMTGEELAKATMEFNFTPKFIEDHPDAVETAIKISNARDPAATFRAAQGLVKFDVRKRLKELKAPTLVANGEDDQVIPLSTARDLAEHIKGARLLIMHKGRHMSIIERADEFNKAVLDFLKKIKK
jgi:3-oxoadipate enol-lactonase